LRYGGNKSLVVELPQPMAGGRNTPISKVAVMD
jgi:hypothetical protein